MSLPELVSEYATTIPDRVAIRFIHDSKEDPSTLTWLDLHDLAVQMASQLLVDAERGDRIAIAAQPGPGIPVTLLACFYAGLIAVPLPYPDRPASKARLESVIDDCTPRSLVIDSLDTGTRDYITQLANLKHVEIIELSLEKNQEPRELTPVRVTASDVAFLQYTSGSTGDPKGVVITHGNILANVHGIAHQVNLSSEDSQVCWLPPHHDFGLTFGILVPWYLGSSVTLMSPFTFLRDPNLWFDAITRYNATYTASPNFGLAYATRKIRCDREFDLTSLRILAIGAEPISATTCSQFTTAFEQYGLDPSVMTPAYGMAEATLAVTCREASSGVSSSPVQLGQPLPKTRVRIVDADSLKDIVDGESGEVLIQSPSVAERYWNRGDLPLVRLGEPGTDAHIENSVDGLWLRTGDLGSIHDGELVIRGRLKDLIIIRGENIVPSDVEQYLESSFSWIRPGCCAVIQSEKNSQLIRVVAEITQDSAKNALDSPELFSNFGISISRNTSKNFGVSVDEVIFLSPHGMPKTTSGKIQRQPLREALDSGTIPTLKVFRQHDTHPEERKSESVVLDDSGIARKILDTFSNILEVRATLDTDFFASGGDSLSAVEVWAICEAAGIKFPVNAIYDHPTPRALTEIAYIADAPVTSPGSMLTEDIADPNLAEAPLSPVQRRWARDYLGDSSRSWGNMTFELGLGHGRTFEDIRHALDTVWARHDALRTVFPGTGWSRSQRVLEVAPLEIIECDAAAFNGSEGDKFVGKAFDLATGPNARCAIIRSKDTSEDKLLGVVHHMNVDSQSLKLIQAELQKELARPPFKRLAIQQGDSEGAKKPVSPLAYSEWLNSLESSGRLDESKAYWSGVLSSPLPSDSLVDRDNVPADNFDGAAVATIMPKEVLDRLLGYAQRSRVGLSAVVLTAFVDQLFDFTGRDDVIVGTPLAGRDRRDLRTAVGMFINQVPLRFSRPEESSPQPTDIPGRIESAQKILLNAVYHQRYQLDMMVKDAGLSHPDDRFPVTNVFFSRMSSESPVPLNVEPLRKLAQEVRFEMMFYAIDHPDGMVLECRYRDSLFTASDITKIVGGVEQALNSL